MCYYNLGYFDLKYLRLSVRSNLSQVKFWLLESTRAFGMSILMLLGLISAVKSFVKVDIDQRTYLFSSAMSTSLSCNHLSLL